MLIVAEDFRKRVAEDSAGLVETHSVFLEVRFGFVVIPFEPNTHSRFISRQISPQGKPAGLRSVPPMRDGADVALLIPGKSPIVTHLSSASGLGIDIPKLSISGQVFQGSP